MVDSALLYAASDSLKFKVSWVRVSAESEWTHFGTGDEVNRALVTKTINEYFFADPLNVVFGRKDSVQINKSEINKVIHDALGKRNFFIWDKEFKRAIEFNHIGVLRVGYI